MLTKALLRRNFSTYTPVQLKQLPYELGALEPIISGQLLDFHYSKHKLIEVVPDKKIVWLITDSNLNSFTDKNEWNGTKISFEITEKDGKTYVRFTHWGLVPQIECFGACSNAWTGYITQSLRDLIVTGRGWPAQHA